MAALWRREEAEYLGVFAGVAPDGTGLAGDAESATDAAAGTAGNAPGVEITPPEPESVEDAAEDTESSTGVGSDLKSIREELKRRRENPQ